ncbi:Hypothetical protein IALB_1931 [Ignavibacterium album JCM 16511]|uniref:Uncharacterized protein n=1 Tax=Ignavibacterium album (strain DSM 19864 / JCM 16511 / NBRC 101810 / Mat9-16) TaxID=945713 RepID=I0AKY0_IGNAJ|nr:hypothetical protein [Ignavibacterium album]AFH49637.1 Hypothetical protein IALB_1931 [Ignavibacterium album JCM 16511]
MSRIGKRLEKFCNPNFKQEIPRDDLESILNHFFPNSWSFGDTRGSHNYRIWHEKFKEYPGKYGNEGMLTIPTSGGKKIKFFYLRMLCEAIKLIKE